MIQPVQTSRIRGRPRTRRRGSDQPSLSVADLKAHKLPVMPDGPVCETVTTARGEYAVRVESDRNTERTLCTLDGIPVGIVRLDPPCGSHGRSRLSGRPGGRWLFVAPCCGRRVERLFMVSPGTWQCRHCAGAVYETESRTAGARAAIAAAKAAAQAGRRKGEKLVRYVRRQARLAKARAVLDSLSRLPII